MPTSKSSLNLEDLMQDAPVIAAVKSVSELKKAIKSNCTIIFLLFGNILTIPEITALAKSGNKAVFAHIDLIEGLAGKDVSVDFIAKNTPADGIISTRANMIRYASEVGLTTIQRFFLIDSLAYENVIAQSSFANAVDILPGTQPKVISKLTRQIRLPIIASGLIEDKQDIIQALGAGAQAVSTTNAGLWDV